jgi:hypothetical protein
VLEFRGSVALKQAEDSDADLPATLRAVTDWLEDYHESNRNVLDRIGGAYAAACGFLALEIVLWTASYGDTRF